MKIAVMQPYLFPYLGYYQMASSVDKFVFFDDVNFIKKGYIHRNEILVNGLPNRFSVPLKKVSQNDLIKNVRVSTVYPDWKVKFLKTIELSYSKSKNYKEVLPLLHDVLDSEYIAEIASQSVIKVLEYLSIETSTFFSSQLNYMKLGSGQEKILSICKLLKATSYTNAIGGKELYENNAFINAQIELNFIEMKTKEVGELFMGHPSHLSMLHFLFHFDKTTINRALSEFKRVKNN